MALKCLLGALDSTKITIQTLENSRMTQTNLEIDRSPRFFRSLLDSIASRQARIKPDNEAKREGRWPLLDGIFCFGFVGSPLCNENGDTCG